MARPTDETALLIHLQCALDSEYGIEIELLSAADARLIRQKLYAIRKDHHEYRSISFSQKGERLWLLKVLEDDPLTRSE